MQHIDPDMDDVFKKAADKYPLKTDTADWEAISQKLRANENNIEGDIENKVIYRERKWALLFLLLLIPAGLIVTQYFKVNNEHAQSVAKVKDKTVQSSPADKTGNVVNKSEPDKQANSEIHGQVNEPVSGNVLTSKRNDNTTIAMKNNEVIVPKELITNPLILEGISAHNNLNKSFLPEYMNDDALKNKSATALKNMNYKLAESSKNANAAVKENNTFNKKTIKQTTGKSKRFYIGALIAPEFTSVKFQPVKRTSFNLGVLMGYDLSDKITVELGVILAHKYYYTDGKYIAPHSIRRDNSTILNVNAFNSITEIPLTLQYNIKNEKNARFFVSAGCVSYVIHKENYRYTYKRNGQEKQSIKYYNKASNNLFANVQISGGYEYAVNKTCNIRVEPYYRIPLGGIGISDLPVTSVG